MPNHSDHQFDSNGSLDDALQLVSRQLDETLTYAELSQLAAFEVTWPSEMHEFRNRCQQVRGMFQTLPVAHISNSLFDVSASATSEESSVGINRTNRRSPRKFYGGLLASVLCGGLMLAFIRPWDVRDAVQTGTDSGLMQSSPIVAANAEHDSMPAAPLQADLILPEMDSLVASNDQPQDLRIAEQQSVEDENSIRPLYQSDNWNVVVVKVNGQNRDEAMDQIQAIVQQHGLRLQRSSDNPKSDWLGVVLTSTVQGSDDAVSAIEAGVGKSQPDSVGTRSIEQSAYTEIVSAVRESLRHPTRSELHHGEIFVALPTAQNSARQMMKSAASGQLSDPVDVKDGSTSTGEEHRLNFEKPLPKASAAASADSSASNLVENAPAVVTLLVLEFESPRIINNGDSSIDL